jgi:hypothetical protein
MLSLTGMFFGNAIAQKMYVSSGATLHYSGNAFASGVIDNENGGTFSVSANYVHSANNYVKGPTAFLAAGGAYDVSLESGADSRIPSFTATGVATVSYAATAPTGTAPIGYTLANAELYTFTGKISAGSATPLASTTFAAGANGAVIVVFANADGGTWTTTATAGTTTVMSFAKVTVLGTDEFNAANFSFYPNPVRANATSINFYLPSSVNQLDVTMYDYTGKTVKTYKNVSVQAGVNSINKPNVANGLYVLQFSFNNGEQQTTKKIVIE